MKGNANIMFSREKLTVTLGLITAILLGGFIYWFISDDKNDQVNVYDLLTPDEQTVWKDQVDRLIYLVKSNKMDGPNINEKISFKDIRTTNGEEISLETGRFAILSGYTECGICKTITSKFPEWESNTDIETVFFTQDMAAVIEPKAEAIIIDPASLIEVPGADSFYTPNYLKLVIPGLLLVDRGILKYKYLGASAARYDIDKVVKEFADTGITSAEEFHMEQNQEPKVDVELSLLDGTKSTIPSQQGIDVVIATQPSCPTCQVATPALLDRLTQTVKENDYPVTIWLVHYDNPYDENVMRDYQKRYPNVRVGFVEGIPEEHSRHPLESWGRILRPDTLIFKDHKFVMQIPVVTSVWQSLEGKDDASVFVEATTQLLTEVVSSETCAEQQTSCGTN
jgi:hypothetical protein